MDLLLEIIREEVCKLAKPKQTYNHRNYTSMIDEAILEEDPEGDWIKIRRGALERMFKIIHPSSSETGLK